MKPPKTLPSWSPPAPPATEAAAARCLWSRRDERLCAAAVATAASTSATAAAGSGSRNGVTPSAQSRLRRRAVRPRLASSSCVTSASSCPIRAAFRRPSPRSCSTCSFVAAMSALAARSLSSSSTVLRQPEKGTPAPYGPCCCWCDRARSSSRRSDFSTPYACASVRAPGELRKADALAGGRPPVARAMSSASCAEAGLEAAAEAEEELWCAWCLATTNAAAGATSGFPAERESRKLTAA